MLYSLTINATPNILSSFNEPLKYEIPESYVTIFRPVTIVLSMIASVMKIKAAVNKWDLSSTKLIFVARGQGGRNSHLNRSRMLDVLLRSIKSRI